MKLCLPTVLTKKNKHLYYNPEKTSVVSKVLRNSSPDLTTVTHLHRSEDWVKDNLVYSVGTKVVSVKHLRSRTHITKQVVYRRGVGSHFPHRIEGSFHPCVPGAEEIEEDTIQLHWERLITHNRIAFEESLEPIEYYSDCKPLVPLTRSEAVDILWGDWTESEVNELCDLLDTIEEPELWFIEDDPEDSDAPEDSDSISSESTDSLVVTIRPRPQPFVRRELPPVRPNRRNTWAQPDVGEESSTDTSTASTLTSPSSPVYPPEYPENVVVPRRGLSRLPFIRAAAPEPPSGYLAHTYGYTTDREDLGRRIHEEQARLNAANILFNRFMASHPDDSTSDSSTHEDSNSDSSSAVGF